MLRLSVVVPAHDAAADLVHSLAALQASDLPRNLWEAIVVDDSSIDRTSDVADRMADRTVPLSGGPRGPAYARNRGAECALAPIVAFVDSDVMVHSDTLRLMLEDLERDEITGVFGSYDDAPTAPGIVSQYRNLLHHYVHQRSAGKAQSFWAGCGALKKSALFEVGMFDESRFGRPEVEDVELGYRLREVHHEILLDRRILATHRKRWTLRTMIASDFNRRGVPWARLLLERRMLLRSHGPSLGASARLSAIVAALFAFSLAVAILTDLKSAGLLAAAALALFVVVNRRFLAWLARIRGFRFVLSVVPLHLIYNFVALCAFGYGFVLHILKRYQTSSGRDKVTPQI